MAIVVNRTTKQCLKSVNTPNYDVADWIHNPDLTAVQGVPSRHWKIVGDVITEMSQAEKDVEDAFTTIERWDSEGLQVVNDFLAVRRKIYDLFVDPAKGWANCTNAERDLLIKYHAYIDTGDGVADTDKATHLITTGQATDPADASNKLRIFWNNFNEKNKENLAYRWVFAKLVAVKYLNNADAENLFDTVKVLLSDMMMIGRLGVGFGISGDNVSGILNYVMSTEEFAGIGMEHDGYTLLTGTWTDFKDEIRNILEFGIYNKADYNG